ncbi:MAG: hypothetical protein ACTSYA_06280 [Candidatus Kariarchaeaceae archaeon]
MNKYNRNKNLVFLCLSIIFLVLIIFDSELLAISITRSVIGLFLAIFVVGDEVRYWVFRSSSSKIDGYEIFALNIAFSISFLILLGAILSYFHLFTGFILSVSLATLIIISLLFRLFLEYRIKTIDLS